MSDDEFFFEYKHEQLDYPKDIIKDLSEKLFDFIVELNELEEIEGLSIFSVNGKQPMIFASEEKNFDNLKTVAEVISTMDPRNYFKDLMDFEYRGLGHLNLEDFEIFMAKIDDQNLFLILTTDPTSALFDKGQKTVNALREIVSVLEEDDEEEETNKSEPSGGIAKKKFKRKLKKKELTRADLAAQLREKLDGLKKS